MALTSPPGLHWLQQHHLPLCPAWQSTLCGGQQDCGPGDVRLTPFLNPFILTLRNETFKAVLAEPDAEAERPPPGIVRGLRDSARLSQPGHSVRRQGTSLGGMTLLSFFRIFPLCLRVVTTVSPGSTLAGLTVSKTLLSTSSYKNSEWSLGKPQAGAFNKGKCMNLPFKEGQTESFL